MRILITGASGYIGKTLYNALKEIYQVTAITRNEADLTKASEVEKFFNSSDFFDVVLHCATAGAPNPRSKDWNIMDNNLTMYYNLLQYRKHYSKLIHFGSGAETYLPITPYGYSKRVIAKSVLNQGNFYNIKIFGVFDENELDTRFIKANIKRYLAKESMQVYKNKVMDFFYMGDLIKVVEYYINEKEPLKEFDCVYNYNYSLKEIASIINNLDTHEVAVDIKEEGTDYYVSSYRTKIPVEFTGLEEGIKNVYNKLKQEKF